jgi:hypothetical protein
VSKGSTSAVKTGNFKNLIGCYFHEDWMKEAPTAVAALEIYLTEWPIQEIPKALSELNMLLAHPDDEVVQFVMEMGAPIIHLRMVYPTGNG